MKAISIHPYFASAITTGMKLVELRTWRTNYRGKILICSTKADCKNKDFKDYFIFGKALALADLVECVKYREELREISFLDDDDDFDYSKDYYAFLLDNIKPLIPFDVKGQQRIYNVDIEEENLEYIDENMSFENWNPSKIENYWIDHNFIKEKPFEFENETFNILEF